MLSRRHNEPLAVVQDLHRIGSNLAHMCRVAEGGVLIDATSSKFVQALHGLSIVVVEVAFGDGRCEVLASVLGVYSLRDNLQSQADPGACWLA
jgi:hypothetical protein